MKEYDEDDDYLYVEMIMIMMKMRIIMKMTTTCMRRRRDDNQLQEVVWHPPHSLLFTGKVIIISFFSIIIITRSCAAIQAADLDWIQFGRVHFGVFSMSWGGLTQLFPLYMSNALAELWGTVKSCQITQMVEIRHVSQEQGDISFSSLPAGLGGKGEFERKFDGKFERK